MIPIQRKSCMFCLCLLYFQKKIMGPVAEKTINLSSGCAQLPSCWSQEPPGSRGGAHSSASSGNHILGHGLPPNHVACRLLVLLSEAYTLDILNRATQRHGESTRPLPEPGTTHATTYRYKLHTLCTNRCLAPHCANARY